MSLEEIASRFDNRAGYRVVAYGVVGLPVYRLTAIGLCLVRKALSPIEEFVLRSVAAQVDSVEDIQGLLGLDTTVVEGCVAELLRGECVRFGPVPSGTGRRLALSPKGIEVVREQESVSPSEQTIVFCVDGLTRRPRFYSPELLYKPRELKSHGIPEVRAFPARPPEMDEIDIKDVVNVVRLDRGRAESPRELLRINKIERRDRIFLEAMALAYRADSGKEVHTAFVIDGRLSVEHEQAFARVKGVERTNIFRGLQERAVTPLMEDLLGEELSRQIAVAAGGEVEAEDLRREARVARARISGARNEVVQGRQKPESTALDRMEEELMAVEEKIARMRVRPLAVYEHAPLLKEAIERAERRLLIISPWIRRAVVDHAFVSVLREALRRGVNVFIGYGLGSKDGEEKQWDREARQDLEQLAKELPRLVLRRFGDTHAKVLIKDSEYFVVSSFNWLSFRGNSREAFREEWGTLVAVPSIVDDYFQRLMTRFE